MNLYRCFTRGYKRDTYLGHWYAPTPLDARQLARSWHEIVTSQPYGAPIVAEPAVAWDKAYNANNKGKLPRPITSGDINSNNL